MRPLAALAAALALLPALATAAEANAPDDTVALGRPGGVESGADLALSISRASPVAHAEEVVIARDDAFADALSSGVLQRAAPLLLVPPQGPLPQGVIDEIARLGATRVTILGGVAAVSAEVEAALAALGLEITRLAGDDRFATAVAVAEQRAPAAETALLVRGVAAAGGDSTAAFSDSLAAGGLAARTGWPVLLTASEALTPSTAQHLADSAISRVLVVGGPDAIAPQVEADLEALRINAERVAGPDRAATAVALAATVGAASRHLIVVDGFAPDAWTGGFAAANRAALHDAPVLLGSTEQLPDATRAYLADAAPGLGDSPVLTCIRIGVATCERARAALGLPPAAGVATAPREHHNLAPGQPLGITVVGAPAGHAAIDGTCTAPATVAFTPGQQFTVPVAPAPIPRPCTVDVTVDLSPTTRQTETFTFNDQLRDFTLAATGDILIHEDVTAHARQPDGRIDFAPLLDEVAPAIGAADVGLCHLEVPLTTDHGDLSGYPTFNAPGELAAGIATTGWDVCSTASNHTLDQGFEGIVATLDILDAAGVAHTGSARTAEEAAPLIRDVAGTAVAFLSWTYGTNGIRVPPDKPWSVNLIDAAAITAQAHAARDAGAEVVVLSLHWGEEYSHSPSGYQTANADAVTRDGLVDLVVGHHAHVIQPVITVNGVPVAYGLGNFLSGQFQSADRSDGVILEATFTEVAAGDWTVGIDWTPTRVDPASYHVRLLDNPQTAADQASAARTNAYLTP